MRSDEFQDSALVLFGHGTSLNAESSAALRLQGAELRRRRVFAEVHEAFWKQAPNLLDVVGRVKLPTVYLVPFFLSEGYFSEQVIPAALGFPVSGGKVVERVLVRDGAAWYYCAALGTHDSIVDVLLDRAETVVKGFPFPSCPSPSETTLFLAGHGTPQDPRSKEAVERHAATIRSKGLYSEVHTVFLEEEPRISRWHELAVTRYVVVVPFFVGNGLHVQEDIPVLLGEPQEVVQSRLKAGKWPWRNPTEKRGKLVWYAPSVGTDPLMPEVIIARAREARASFSAC